jgi:hypothetical protein
MYANSAYFQARKEENKYNASLLNMDSSQVFELISSRS